MDTRSFRLTERLSSFVDAEVASGRHRDASEVVGEALERYEADPETERARAASLRATVAEGRAAIERGDFVRVGDGAASREDLERRLNARAAELAAAATSSGSVG